jgi:DNA polymerase-1
MSHVLIIDGNAIVHRAFHAYPPSLTDNQGRPINAVYGWITMMTRAIEELSPTHLAVTFDRPSPTFRKTLYVGYQANRPKMADGLSEQIVTLHEALERLHACVFEIDGYEADDIIGTITRQAKEQSMISTILSADRDLLQLVDDTTRMYAPVTGISKSIMFDEAKVREEFGITPGQIPDYKALVGDQSDGYPGVVGIGPKAAVELLTTWRNIESIYQHLSDIPDKYQLKLASGAEQAVLCKTLATIVRDTPVHFNESSCALTHMTRSDFLAVCETYGFKSLTKRASVFRSDASEQMPLL